MVVIFVIQLIILILMGLILDELKKMNKTLKSK